MNRIRIVQPNEIEQEVGGAIMECAGRLHGLPADAGSSTWTNELKAVLSRLGLEKGFIVLGVPVPQREDREYHDVGGWLWDLSWARGNPRSIGSEFTGIVLATEIEWGNPQNNIIEDFRKLTVAECQHRLSVFWLPDESEADSWFDILQRSSLYSPGKRYMAIGIGSSNDYSRHWRICRTWEVESSD